MVTYLIFAFQSFEENDKQKTINHISEINTKIYDSSTVKNNYKSENDEIEQIKKFHKSLENSDGPKYFAQHSEDSILFKLAEYINITRNGSYVEFGTQDGTQINTRYLRENFGWKGLLMDGSPGLKDNPIINLHIESITHENILDLFQKYQITREFDILSEDTDYADYWIMERILSKYSPKIVVHEINQQGPDKCVSVIKPNKLTFLDYPSEYHGASVCAFQCLAKRFNYTMVYCEKSGVNCFWLRDDLLFSLFKIRLDLFKRILTPAFLWRQPGFKYRTKNDTW